MNLSFLQSRPDRSWPETTATVIECLALSGGWDAEMDRQPLYSVRCAYRVEGRTYHGCFKSRTRYEAGIPLLVRYHPQHPERNSTDPAERPRTGLLIACSLCLVALYVVLSLHW